MQKTQTLIIGSNSAIAKAVIKNLSANKLNHIVAIGRECTSQNPANIQPENTEQLVYLTLNDYSEASIVEATNQALKIYQQPFNQVIICNGLLHNEKVKPEKRIADFSEQEFISVLKANTITPILWIKHLATHLKSKTDCKVLVLSARVGSISDNRLGGWYSYRSSKAALNMMLKNIAIEFSVAAKNIKVIAFHPGTTDTPLSKPYQKNVVKEKLFTADFVAERLLAISHQLQPDGKLSFIDWDGKEIEW